MFVLREGNSRRQSISSGFAVDLCLYRKRVRLGIPLDDLRLLLPPRADSGFCSDAANEQPASI